MFGKDKMKKMSDAEKKAKMTALSEAHGLATDMLKDKVKGLKKVTVASDSKEGLKKGLEKAEDLLGKEESEDEEMEEGQEENSEESDKSDEYSPEIPEDCDTEEEIDALIAKLEEKKRSLKA